MLNTSFNYKYEQRNLRFPCYSKMVGWQTEVNTDTGTTVHTDYGFAENKYFLKPNFIMDVFIVLILQKDMRREGCLAC